MIAVGIPGAAGRMGRMLIKQLATSSDLKLVSAMELASSPSIGQDAGTTCGLSSLSVPITSDVSSLLEQANVIIDFTVAEATAALVTRCAEKRCAMVIGTTGLTSAQEARVQQAAQKIPIVWSANMSIGVNVLLSLVNQAARLLGDSYDVEIVEAHHRHKRDAPSGTALSLAQSIASATSKHGTLNDRACYGREGHSGERPAQQIGIHAVRGGEIVGDHTVIFAGADDRLELIHRAQERHAFAVGAVRAARWVHTKPPGLYTMQHVLGLPQ